MYHGLEPKSEATTTTKMGMHVTDLANSWASSLVLSVKYIFLIGQLAMILVSNSNSGSDNVAQAIKCVCNPQECDFIRPEDCPGKGYIVWDPCKWVLFNQCHDLSRFPCFRQAIVAVTLCVHASSWSWQASWALAVDGCSQTYSSEVVFCIHVPCRRVSFSQ